MRRSLFLAATFFLAVAALPGLAQGQIGFVLGAGATFPMGDYGDFAKTGWMVNGGVWAPVGEARALGVLGEVFYGSNSHDEDVVPGKTNLYGGYAGATYRLGDPTRPGVFLVGKVGALAHNWDLGDGDTTLPEGEEETTWDFSYGGGVGLSIPRGAWVPWILVQYIGAGDTQFIPVSVGFTYVPGGR
jgi:hypothetical protein